MIGNHQYLSSLLIPIYAELTLATYTDGSTQLALRKVFTTVYIGLFFPKVDKSIDGDFVNNEFEGFLLDDGYEMTG